MTPRGNAAGGVPGWCWPQAPSSRDVRPGRPAAWQALRVTFDYNLLHLQSRGLPAVRLQHRLQEAGSHSLLYCAVTADSLAQAADWEQRILQLGSVARVVSLVKYLTEDLEPKRAIIEAIREDLADTPSPVLDARTVSLKELTAALSALRAYLGLASDVLRLRGEDPAAEGLVRSLRNSVTRLRRLTMAADPTAAPRGGSPRLDSGCLPQSLGPLPAAGVPQGGCLAARQAGAVHPGVALGRPGGDGFTGAIV